MTILFDNIRLYTAGAFFPKQKVLIEKGKIASVGSKVLKNVDNVIDGDGKYLMPALIDAHTHLGLFDGYYSKAKCNYDMSEIQDPITPHLRPLDGIKMRHKSIQDARRAGVAVCMVCPGAITPIAGQCSILKTNANSADVGLIVEQAGIKFCFGEEVKNTLSSNKKFPSTRMGIAAIVRETLLKAQDYLETKNSKKGIKERNPKFEALIPLLEGQIPMRATAYRAEDILTAIRIAEEFNLKIVLEHATEAHLIADILAKKNIPVVLSPALVPEIRYELSEKSFESVKILMDAGVTVALSCDFPGLPMESLRIVAAMAVQYGLDEKRAISSVTENPAKILGINERCGQVKKGYDADLVLFSGHPLDIRSKLELLVIDGEVFKFE